MSCGPAGRGTLVHPAGRSQGLAPRGSHGGATSPGLPLGAAVCRTEGAPGKRGLGGGRYPPLVMDRRPSPPSARPGVEPGSEGPPGLRRALLIASGWLALGLAALGTITPLLPTTPFVLLAAACFMRSSPRFHEALLRHRVFGPLLSTWRAQRALPPGVKPRALVVVVLTLLASAAWLRSPAAWVFLAALGVVLVTILARLPVAAGPSAGSSRPAGMRGDGAAPASPREDA